MLPKWRAESGWRAAENKSWISLLTPVDMNQTKLSSGLAENSAQAAPNANLAGKWFKRKPSAVPRGRGWGLVKKRTLCGCFSVPKGSSSSLHLETAYRN